MNYRRIPQSAAGFVRAIRGYKDFWSTGSFPSDHDDLVFSTKILFWRADDPKRLATVADSHGQLLVCFAPKLHAFELDKLHEGLNGKSWRKLLECESWCRPEHLALMDTLYFLFPPPPDSLGAPDSEENGMPASSGTAADRGWS